MLLALPAYRAHLHNTTHHDNLSYNFNLPRRGGTSLYTKGHHTNYATRSCQQFETSTRNPIYLSTRLTHSPVVVSRNQRGKG